MAMPVSVLCPYFGIARNHERASPLSDPLPQAPTQEDELAPGALGGAGGSAHSSAAPRRAPPSSWAC
eukprot:5763237-Pyramimonas_sp.AAC.1